MGNFDMEELYETIRPVFIMTIYISIYPVSFARQPWFEISYI